MRIDTLADVPASGLPSNQDELAQQIQSATYQKLCDMWAQDGIGKALHEAQARLPHFKARLLDQRVVQYAAASVVSSMALSAAGRVEMDAPRDIPRGTEGMLTALQDKTRVQAWAVYETADGQLYPHQIARAPP